MDGSNEKFEIHRAAMEGDIMIVRGLLAQNPRLAIQKDLDNRTPLHWAASKYPEICKVLLHPFEAVADGDMPQGSTGAVSDSEVKKVKKFEIDLDELTDDSGWTPLHIAVSAGNIDCVKVFLSFDPKPDVNQQTSMGQTCLHYAVSKNYNDIVELLLANGASAKVKDRRGQYPLHRAAANGSVGLVTLLAKQASFFINAKDASGWTALHHALSEGHADVAIALVKLGADPKVEDSDGNTPLKVSVDEKVAKFFMNGCKEEGIEVS